MSENITGSVVFDLTVVLAFEVSADGTSTNYRVQSVEQPQHVRDFDLVGDDDPVETDEEIAAVARIVDTITANGSHDLARMVQQHLQDVRENREPHDNSHYNR